MIGLVVVGRSLAVVAKRARAHRVREDAADALAVPPQRARNVEKARVTVVKRRAN